MIISRKDIVDITKGHCLVGLLLLCLSCWSWYPVAAAPVDDESYVDYYKDYFENNGVHIYTSNYDWVPLAKKITTGCTTDYQRIKAIYYWVCDNIDYDTSFEIYRADSCIAYRKGVCQAYCEVFYQLAKVVGVKVELVNGYSKDEVGFVSGSGHTWLFAYTGEKRGIFLDPTWGAGIMRDHKFVRNTDYWKWFNVHPEWLILTHYPEKEAYQLIDNPITFETFRSMPIAMPLWLEYGLKLHDIYMMARNDSVSLPKFYNNGEGDFEIIDIPMCKSLKVGQFYTFRIRKKADRELAIINGDEHCLEKDWTSEGNGVYSTTFMPRATGRLTFALKNNATNSNYSNLLEYSIDAPTSSDWQQVEKVYPLSVPDAKGVANLNIMYADAWEKAGVNGHKLLSIIRQQHITALPTIYNEKGQKLKILSVPMTNSLVLGQEYTFQFHPESGAEWAIVNNGKWYRDWKYTDGYYTMTIRPTRTGLLMLCVRMAEGGSFWSALSYEVK
jgi:hypothetical protein